MLSSTLLSAAISAVLLVQGVAAAPAPAAATAPATYDYPEIVTNSGAPNTREDALYLRVFSFSGSAYNGRTVQIRPNGTNNANAVVDQDSPVLQYFIRQGTIFQQNQTNSNAYKNAGPVAGLHIVNKTTSKKGNTTTEAFQFRELVNGEPNGFVQSTTRWQEFLVDNDGVYQLYQNIHMDDVSNGFIICDVNGGITGGGYGQLFYYLTSGDVSYAPKNCEFIAVQSVIAPLQTTSSASAVKKLTWSQTGSSS